VSSYADLAIFDFDLFAQEVTVVFEALHFPFKACDMLRRL
jgi:hypothetical protein